ncbi:prefoldin subunit alpha [Candidatus Pacearchaeota archaeon ex4484_26]|nr:MAG: prefoldin subunit alpha [Candidatus Pacearchaeota archaeon ex4484_26]RLG10824.1 MAG: prefoldin subunit alpha [Candidatus Pacearchaeota archaeon]
MEKEDREKDREKRAQEKVIEFSMLEQENKKLEQQLQSIDQQILLFDELKINLSKISKHKGEFLSSLGPGVFMKSKLLDNKKFLINVGTGIVVEKEHQEAEKIIDQQIKKLKEARNSVEGVITKNFNAMIKIEGELKELVKK